MMSNMAEDDGMGASSIGVKRARRGSSKSIRRAIAISSRIKKDYPYSTFGRAYLRRGTPENVSRFGSTYKLASADQRAARKAVGYVGRGGYWGRLIGDKVGDMAGAAVRNLVPYGDAIMGGVNLLGRAHRSYTGRGNYTVTNDIVHGGQTAFSVPSFVPSSDGAEVCISHKEYVQNIYAPTGTVPFANLSFQINPGLEEVFPWLSQVAVNYEEYELKQCMFTFRSTVSDFNSGTGQCGQVIMATQYNSSLPPFADKLAMMSYSGAQSSKTTEHQVQGVECDPSKLSGSPGKYVRWQPIGIDQDLKEYDHAQFNIAVADIPGSFINQSIGELWVSYTVVLRKPKLVVNRALNLDRDFFCLLSNGTGSAPLAARPATEPLLGTASAAPYLKLARNNNIGITIVPGGSAYTTYNVYGTRLVFPPAYSGSLQIALEWVVLDAGNGGFNGMGVVNSGNVTWITDNPTIATGGGSPGVGVWSGGEGPQFSTCTGAGSTTNLKKYTSLLHFQVNPATSGVQNYVELYPIYLTAAPTSILYAQIDVMEYNSSFRNKLNGTNDTMALMDLQGNPVVFP